MTSCILFCVIISVMARDLVVSRSDRPEFDSLAEAPSHTEINLNDNLGKR